jgi:hypothetical protein
LPFKRNLQRYIVVLILSTMDLRVGFIATLTIAGIVTTVMGVGVKAIMGWSLGIGGASTWCP